MRLFYFDSLLVYFHPDICTSVLN